MFQRLFFSGENLMSRVRFTLTINVNIFEEFDLIHELFEH